MSIQLIIQELHKAFDLLNKHIFDNTLPEVIITIQSGGKCPTNGWCTIKEVWFCKEESNKRYEINITAERLNSDFLSVIETLLHEMIHLYNNVHSIKDVSNSFYHNKNFKKSAEKFGMYYKNNIADKKYGWAFAIMTPETLELIKSFNIDLIAFNWYRNIKEKKKKKLTSYKLECPECGIKLRATKSGIQVICKICKKELVQR